jgi:predicted nuclease with TOPRIM domain
MDILAVGVAAATAVAHYTATKVKTDQLKTDLEETKKRVKELETHNQNLNDTLDKRYSRTDLLEIRFREVNAKIRRVLRIARKDKE